MPRIALAAAALACMTGCGAMLPPAAVTTPERPSIASDVGLPQEPAASGNTAIANTASANTGSANTVSTRTAEPSARRGASHEAGATMFALRGHYAVPILQKSIAWDGNGEVDHFGLGGYIYAFIVDGLAIGGGINGTVFKTNGHDEFGLEIETAARIYVLEFEDVSAFIDITGGWLQTTGQVPEGGTEWNGTFSFGPGVDVPIGESTSLQVAAIYHHMSNALGRDHDRNPSQNEGRFTVGVAWDF